MESKYVRNVKGDFFQKNNPKALAQRTQGQHKGHQVKRRQRLTLCLLCCPCVLCA